MNSKFLILNSFFSYTVSKSDPDRGFMQKPTQNLSKRGAKTCCKYRFWDFFHFYNKDIVKFDKNKKQFY